MANVSKIDRGREKEKYKAMLNRLEIIKARLSRRDLFKMGLLTTAGYLVAKKGLSSRVHGQTTSPSTRAFIEPLPTHMNGGMVIKQPVPSLNPAPTVAPAVLYRMGPTSEWPTNSATP